MKERLLRWLRQDKPSSNFQQRSVALSAQVQNSASASSSVSTDLVSELSLTPISTTLPSCYDVANSRSTSNTTLSSGLVSPASVERADSITNSSNLLTSIEPSPGTTATQSPQKTLWDRAVDTLTLAEKAFIQERVTTSVSSHTDFITILKTVQERKTKCEEEPWKVTFKGREFALCDVADTICAGLDKFKQIGDVAVNVDPLHAGLPWAGIRFLLQV